MTDDDWAARRDRIAAIAKGSDQRVKEFIELVAEMCVSRTTRPRARSKSARQLDESALYKRELDRLEVIDESRQTRVA